MQSKLLFLSLLMSAAAAQTMPEPYGKLCAGCHGDSATGTDRGPNLVNARSLRSRSEARIRQTISQGTPGGMPAFPLPDAQIGRAHV